jgi:GntR family transcriptional regulator/MocR family aminotransferase
MHRATESVSDDASNDRELLLLDFTARRGRLRQGLGEAMRAAIQDGRLPAGTVLPASRQLASQLGVSRGVASDAYDQLACEGYVQIKPRSAPVVALVAASTPVVPAANPVPWRFDFTATTPDVGLFPRHAWSRAVHNAAASISDAGLD